MSKETAKPSAPPAAAAPAPRPASPAPVPDPGPGRRGFLGKMNPLSLFKKETPASLVRDGRDLMANRNLAQATVMFNRALTLDPNYAPAYDGLGDALVKKGGRSNVELAIQQYRESIRRNPYNDRTYGSIGRVFDMLGRRKEAALEKKKMVVVRTLQADPANPAANNNMGILFLQQGHVDSAIEYFTRAVKTDPRYDTSLRNLAITHYKQAGETKDATKRAAHIETAKDFISRALEIGESPLSLLTLARILILEERHEEALAVCDQVETIDGAMKEVFGLKKVCLMKLNRLEEANKAYETYRFLSAHESR